MFRIILFDVDGVLLRIPRRYSRILQESGYPDAPQALDKFYTTDELCTTGIKDALVEITRYLEEFGWEKGSKAYFDGQFEFERKFLDATLMEYSKTLRNSGIPCFLATDQNHYRKDFLLNGMGFKESFDGWFVSADIGYRKIDEEYWDYTIQKLTDEFPNLSTREILFIDDRIENISIAGKFGIKTFHTPDEPTISSLHELLNDGIHERFGTVDSI